MSKKLGEILHTEAAQAVPQFKKLIPNLPAFEDRGILYSEMLSVCAFLEAFRIDVVIESGRWRGQSTQVLAEYFREKPIVIESIELFLDENAEHVERKLKPYSNVILHYGDTHRLLPQIIERHVGKRIAILFDGPKGKAATDLFRLVIAKNPGIILGFFHDMRQPSDEMPNPSRPEFASEFPDAVYTDDREYVDRFKTLDQSCTTHLWSPWKIDGKPIGSYGPTLGIVHVSPKNRRVAWRQLPVLEASNIRRVIMSGLVLFAQQFKRDR